MFYQGIDEETADLLGMVSAEVVAASRRIMAMYPEADLSRVIPMYDWDLAPAMQCRANDMDPALATLIDDIYTRGLDRKIVVVAMGEFGRTPRLSHAAGLQGRDHWPQAMSVLVSGGGWRMGQVIGATNSKAEYPSERPLTPQDLLATVYHHLGIDPQHEFIDFAGRPQRILYHGTPIRELV